MRDSSPPLGFDGLHAPEGVDVALLHRLVLEHRPWRKLRHIATDAGVDPVAAWKAAKEVRRALWRRIPVTRSEGGSFGVCPGPALTHALFLADRASGDDLLNPRDRITAGSALRKRIDALFRAGLVPDRMRARTLMDESAESSIIEGASATRAEALELLRSGRAPRTPAERMILNNHVAMQFVKRSLSAALTPGLLLELQETLTEGLLDDARGGGRFRRPDEQVRVVDTRDDSTIFVPPPAAKVPELLRELCAFANEEPGDEGFLHPIVKACVLHFLIGYIHPFVDGNGRCARAVFYWHALRSGYGIFEYLSISEIIREGFARYPQAYLDAEADDGDITYFVLYKLDVIEQALDRLAQRLDEERAKIERSERLLKLSKDLNLRQRLLLEHSLRHPVTEYTVKSHMNSNGITPVTARADLEGLVKRRLMTTSKRGREVIYHPTPGLRDRLARKGV